MRSGSKGSCSLCLVADEKLSWKLVFSCKVGQTQRAFHNKRKSFVCLFVLAEVLLKQRKRSLQLETRNGLVPSEDLLRSALTGSDWLGSASSLAGGHQDVIGGGDILETSGRDELDVVGRIKAGLPVSQPSSTPALLVLLPQLQQLLTCTQTQKTSLLFTQLTLTKSRPVCWQSWESEGSQS